MTRQWCVYIVRCRDAALYTGITNDIERRIAEHNSGKKGARYTRARRPVHLAYVELAENRSCAARRECQIKKMPLAEKRKMVKGHENSLFLPGAGLLKPGIVQEDE